MQHLFFSTAVTLPVEIMPQLDPWAHTQESSRDDAEDPQWATSGADRK
jgi:hypothetical protein